MRGGVLHRTGSMWEALQNTLNFVTDDGLRYVAIYNDCKSFGIHLDGRLGSSDLWLKIKRLYSRLPSVVQNLTDYSAMSAIVLLYLASLKNPGREMRTHKSYRGMSWCIDLKDWLGGTHTYTLPSTT